VSKITLNSVADITQSSTAQTTINTDFATIQTAFDNTLSRDGTSPNQMGSNLDMNSNQIINLPAPVGSNSPARLVDVISNPTLVLTIPPVGTSGATVPLNNSSNTFSGNNIFSNTNTFSAANTFANGQILGTPASVNLTNATALPLGSVTGFGAGVATFLATPSTANLAAAVTGETGTGALVFGTSPTLTTPTITSATLTSPVMTTPSIDVATGTSVSVTGTLAAYNATAVPAGGTTGTGIKVSSTSNLGVFFGSGVPTLSAAQGSLYIRTDGSSTSTRMYINTTGSTVWTNVTTAA